MASHAPGGRVPHVSERFRGGGAGDFEGVDGVREAGVGHFVGVGDAEHALAVFVQFGHFGDFGPGDGDEVGEDFGVEGLDAGEGGGGDVVEAGNDFGDGGQGWRGSAGIDALEMRVSAEFC